MRRNMRVRISQRTTLAHWLVSSGRSRQLWIQRAIASPMIGFGGRAHDQRLFQLGLGIGDQPALAVRNQPVMGDDRHFLGEAFDVLGFRVEIARAG